MNNTLNITKIFTEASADIAVADDVAPGADILYLAAMDSQYRLFPDP